MTYTVNAIKTFKTHDGALGYSCNLNFNGKKVADVLEDGWGGEIRIDWLDRSTEAKVKVHRYNDSVHEYDGTKAESLFAEHIFNLPKIKSFDGNDEMHTNSHIEIDRMVNEFLDTKKITSELKKKVLVFHESKVYAFNVKAPHTLETTLKAVKAMPKYKDSQFLNDLPVVEVISIYKAQNLI